jgi:hypothetical protein
MTISKLIKDDTVTQSVKTTFRKDVLGTVIIYALIEFKGDRPDYLKEVKAKYHLDDRYDKKDDWRKILE